MCKKQQEKLELNQYNYAGGLLTDAKINLLN